MIDTIGATYYLAPRIFKYSCSPESHSTISSHLIFKMFCRAWLCSTVADQNFTTKQQQKMIDAIGATYFPILPCLLNMQWITLYILLATSDAYGEE